MNIIDEYPERARLWTKASCIAAQAQVMASHAKTDAERNKHLKDMAAACKARTILENEYRAECGGDEQI